MTNASLTELQRTLCLVLVILPSCLASLPAQRTGVLVAVPAASTENPYTRESHPTEQYETLWIVRDLAHPLRAVTRDLLIAQPTGFWRVGIAASCAYYAQYRNASESDVVWSVPADSVAVVETDAGCAVLDSASRTAATDSTAVTQCDYQSLSISFASANLLSLAVHGGLSEACEARGGYSFDREWVRPVAARDSQIPIEALLGPTARAAYLRAMLGARHNSDELCPVLEPGDVTDDFTSGWSIRRQKRRWRARALQHVGRGVCEYYDWIDTPLPTAIAGAVSSRLPWAVVQHAVPAALDVFSSPAGDMAIIVTKDSLLVFEAEGAALRRRMLAHAIAAPRVILTQWAQGDLVHQWSTRIAELAALERPHVRVEPPTSH